MHTLHRSGAPRSDTRGIVHLRPLVQGSTVNGTGRAARTAASVTKHPKSKNPWLERPLFHWAHQGGAREAPSNTIYALDCAKKSGANGLEFDVHRTKDGHLVLAHDKHLGRITDGKGKIRKKTLAELRQRDAAYWWTEGATSKKDASPEEYILRGRAPKDGTLRIPTLDEALTLFGDCPLTIEIKGKGAVKGVVDRLNAYKVPNENVIVTSFGGGVVRKLRRQAPGLPVAPGWVWTLWFCLRARLGWPPRHSPYVAVQLPHRWAENVPAKWRWLVGLLPRRLRQTPLINPRLLDVARRLDMAVHAWTVNDEVEMRELIALGVDGIMTDRPSVLAAVLAETGGEPSSASSRELDAHAGAMAR